MKISDEQIIDTIIAVRNETEVYPFSREAVSSYGIHFERSEIIDAARKLIALAQEVEPLKWNLNGTNHWSAMTAANRYGIRRDYEKHTLYIDGFAESEHNSSGEAKEAAQQDYAKRMKSGLKYGGGE